MTLCIGAGVAALGCSFIGLGFSLINDLFFRAGLMVILAVSWNFMASTGLISLGHSAFWGLGSYTSMLLVNSWSISFGTSVFAAILAGAAAGALLAVATGRLRGIYFAVATIAYTEALRVAAMMLPDITGGSTGVYLNQSARLSQEFLYSAAIVGAVASVTLVYLLMKTRLRYAMRAMLNNESAAQMLGVNPLLYRTFVSAVAGGVAALAGVLNTWYTGYLSPEIAFSLHQSVLAQIATIIGGVHTQVGPIIGAFVILGLSEITRISLTEFEGTSQLIYGLVLVSFILFLPGGIFGAMRNRWLSWAIGAKIRPLPTLKAQSSVIVSAKRERPPAS
ncbi:branched-chain amino acid ABC transporter permease [Chelatococcus asaccharovorans]|nr:branched-chain amino acid ABC transporter permease [Chelatococcus asaccharovorans]